MRASAPSLYNVYRRYDRYGTAVKVRHIKCHNHEHYWPSEGNKKQDAYYMIIMMQMYIYNYTPCQLTSYIAVPTTMLCS